MTVPDNSTLMKLFLRRRYLIQEMDRIGPSLLTYDPGSAEHHAADVEYEALYDELVDLDEALTSAPIETENDRSALQAVAYWRAAEDDGGLSADLAARLTARLHDLAA
jgi:hypothetical protein